MKPQELSAAQRFKKYLAENGREYYERIRKSTEETIEKEKRNKIK
jgi:hypothetical protein